MTEYEAEQASTRCPLCDASLEAWRSRRLVAAGGRWIEMGQDHWTVRCPNGHNGDGQSLTRAIASLSPR